MPTVLLPLSFVFWTTFKKIYCYNISSVTWRTFVFKSAWCLIQHWKQHCRNVFCFRTCHDVLITGCRRREWIGSRFCTFLLVNKLLNGFSFLYISAFTFLPYCSTILSTIKQNIFYASKCRIKQYEITLV